MKIVLTDSYDVQLSTALLGYVGETNARPVTVEGLTVDGADRYVLTIDYGDGTVYDVDISDGTWTPTADILRSAQTVSCQIAAKKLSGQEYILLKKSRIFRLRIGAAIGDTAIPSPDVAMDALDRMTALGDRITADVQTAVTAAETATTAAENAEKSATTAGVSADTAEQAASRAETAQTVAETSATQADASRQGADTARQQAVVAQNNAKISADLAAAAAQQTTTDKTATAGYAQTAKANADSTATDRQAVSDMAEQVTADKATVAENAAQVATDRKAAETAAQTALESAGSVNQLKEDIANSKKDIAELNDKKITKFYASNLGKTNLPDSDNGKIMDMLIYGKSEQFQGEIELEDGTTVTVPCPDYPQEIKSVVSPTVKVWTDVGTAGKYLTFEQIETVKDNLNLFYNKKGVLFRKSNKYPSETTNADSTAVYWFYNDENSLKFARILSSGVFENAITVGNISDMPESNNDLQIYKGLVSYGIYYFSNTEYKTVSLETTLNISNYTKTEVALPYTINAIPVDSGGNVTIDGQEYIADYVDVERGKLVRMTRNVVLNGGENWLLAERTDTFNGVFIIEPAQFVVAHRRKALCDKANWVSAIGTNNETNIFDTLYNQIRFVSPTNSMTTDEWKQQISQANITIIYQLATATEIDLTDAEVQAFKDLATYYPTTNISVNSEQLDGYTVFNYQISMANGWNYVKQQIGDTRDYIYDMDARAQDTDLQAAEAYVNSEYAVALTELEA